jgi:hypothetical protein
MPSKNSLEWRNRRSSKVACRRKIAYGKTSGQANNYNDQANVGYGKYGSKLRGYFIPNYNSFTSYAKRIVYRAGLKYEKN